MSLLTITEKNGFDVENQLRVASRCGIHDIDPTIAGTTIQSTAQPLADITTSSFSTGNISADIKINKVIPLDKDHQILKKTRILWY